MSLSKTIMEIGDKFLNPITMSNINEPDQPLVYTNKSFRELTKYETEFLIGRNCRLLQGPDTDQEGVARIRRAIKDNEPICQDLINYNRHGDKFFNRLVLMPFMEKNIRYFIGLQNSISEQKLKPVHALDRMFLEDKAFNPLAIIVGQHMMKSHEMEANLLTTFIRIRDWIDSL